MGIMGSIIEAIRKVRAQVLSQVASLALLNAYFLRLRSICVPALNCHSCPAAVFACPIGVLVNFASLRIFPLVAIGILGLAGIIGGRLFCGWLCPFGLIQDGLYRIPTRKFTAPPSLGYAKYLVLILLVVTVPFLFPKSLLVFCRVCPAGTLESSIPWRIIGVSTPFTLGFPIRMTILLGVLILMIVVSRGFCRILCPLGAIFAVFNRVSLFRIRLTKRECKDCGLCASMCPVEIDPVKEMNSPECVRCLKCTSTRHLKLGIK
jgi:ferredoxin-type protein NapH